MPFTFHLSPFVLAPFPYQPGKPASPTIASVIKAEIFEDLQQTLLLIQKMGMLLSTQSVPE
jgi:hypothetical protein